MEADLVEVNSDIYTEKPKVTPRRDKPDRQLAPVKPPANHEFLTSHAAGARTTSEILHPNSQSPSKTVRFTQDVKNDMKTTGSSSSPSLQPVTNSRSEPKENVLPDIHASGQGVAGDVAESSEKEETPAQTTHITSSLDTAQVDTPQVDTQQLTTTPPSREYQRREVTADSSSPTKLPPLAKPELKRNTPTTPTSPRSQWDAAIK